MNVPKSPSFDGSSGLMDGQRAAADSRVLDDEDTALVERSLECRKVGAKGGELRLRPSALAAAEEDHRRPPCPARGQQRGEVRVRRDDGALLERGPIEDLLIGRVGEADLTHVHGVVAGGAEPVGQRR